MSLSTYGQLKTSIATWMHRDDLASVIPDFIALAESDINAKCADMPFLYQRGTATSTAGNPLIDLSGVVRLIDVSYQGNPLRIVNPGAIRDQNTSSGTPIMCSMEGQGGLRLYPTPDAAYSLSVLFCPTISPSLAGSAPDDEATNWILMQFPGVYLFGGLLAAEAYLNNDQRIDTWRVAYNDALQNMRRSRREGDIMFSGDVLRIGMFGNE